MRCVRPPDENRVSATRSALESLGAGPAASLVTGGAYAAMRTG